MTTEQTNNLPISEMLESKEENLQKGYDKYRTEDYKQGLNLLAVIIPQVRSLELSLIEKAKTEERIRIVGIIDEMIEKHSRKSHGYDGTGGYAIDTNRVEEIVDIITNNQ